MGVIPHAEARRPRSKERSWSPNIYIAICAKNRARIAKFFWLARGRVSGGCLRAGAVLGDEAGGLGSVWRGWRLETRRSMAI